MKINHKEILSYFFFGLLTTFLSWVSYTFCINVFDISIFFSNIISWIFSVSFAFVTNKLFVFKSKSWEIKLFIKEFLLFFSSRGVTGLVEIIAVPILAKLKFDNLFYILLEKINIGISLLYTTGLYSKIFISFVIIVLNYFFSKKIVFKKEKR